MIIGHQRQTDYFNTVLARGRLAHAYLFYGPEHIGKFTFATHIAKSLFCQALNEIRDRSTDGQEVLDRTCGRCADCLRIEACSHPHVFFVDPGRSTASEKESNPVFVFKGGVKKEISIDEVREMKRILSFAPEGDRHRIFIMNHADRLSPEAADALLKLLEEPGERTLFILITAYPDFLTPTIRSRSLGIRFSPLSDTILSDLLLTRRVEESERRELLSLANGRPGALFHFLEDEKALTEQRSLVRKLVLLRRNPNLAELFRLSGECWSETEIRDTVFEFMIRMLRKEIIRSSESHAAVAELCKKVKNIIRYRSLLDSSNVNARLAFDNALLEFGMR